MTGRLAGSRAALPRSGRVRRERGIILVLMVIGMVAIIGMTGLALDLGLAYIAKTNLQNALDAAALAGAQQLNLVGETAATAKATAVFNANVTGVTPTVELSDQMTPFLAGHGTTKKYVRVSVATATSPTYFSGVLGFGTLTYGGRALAGPEPQNESCSVLPMALCARNTTDKDCSDYACYGYGTPNTQEQFSITSSNNMGPGNYGYLGLIGNGANDLGKALAGGQTTCVKANDPVDTKTGANAGQVQDGLNTRFNQYPPGGSGNYTSTKYPGDVITTAASNVSATPDYSYSNYQSDLAANNWNNPGGQPKRRTINIVVVDCGAGVNGQSTLTAQGGMCMFLTQPVDSHGGVYAQVIPTCQVKGPAGTPGSGGGGAFRIVLFQATTSS